MLRKKTNKNTKPLPNLAPAPSIDANEIQSQLELEICWCVQKLEHAINEGKLNKKLQEDTLRNLRILKSGTTPLVKKRQVMSAVFGNYRLKMREEEKKMSLAAKQIKFTSAGDGTKKSSFVKKAAIVTSGSGFKFNFEPDVSEKSQLEEKDVPSSNTGQITCNGQSNNFKFNFVVEEPNDNLDFNKLTITY